MDEYENFQVPSSIFMTSNRWQRRVTIPYKLDKWEIPYYNAKSDPRATIASLKCMGGVNDSDNSFHYMHENAYWKWRFPHLVHESDKIIHYIFNSEFRANFEKIMMINYLITKLRQNIYKIINFEFWPNFDQIIRIKSSLSTVI